jgi:hypothetical protein
MSIKMEKSRWVEIISVRLSGPGGLQAVKKIFSQVCLNQEEALDNQCKAELYANQHHGTDWSVILHWNRPYGYSLKTLLGSSIAEAFHSLGLVNHSVWIKKEFNDKRDER